MFKLTTSHRFWATATASIPSETTPDQTEKASFRILFELMPKDESAFAVDAMEVAMRSGAVAVEEQERAQLVRVVKGWDEVIDFDGEPVQFSAAALDQALRFPWFRRAVTEAYGRSISGEATRGN